MTQPPSSASGAARRTSDGSDEHAPGVRAWGIALVLFALTCGSVWWIGDDLWGSGPGLAIPLMAILVAHEAGHYVAARLHGEAPSPPYFLPLPRYARITSGSFCTSAGVPSAILRPKSRATTVSEMAITRPM